MASTEKPAPNRNRFSHDTSTLIYRIGRDKRDPERFLRPNLQNKRRPTHARSRTKGREDSNMLRLRERREASTRSQELQESQSERDHKATENHHILIMARRPFRQEAGEQSAKQQEYLNGPKATTSGMPTRPHTPTTTRSQSPLSRTSPPQTPLPPHSPPPPPPRSPLGTPGKPLPPAHQTSPARSRHSPNCPQRTLSPATKSQRKEKQSRKENLRGQTIKTRPRPDWPGPRPYSPWPRPRKRPETN